jgi:DNA-directed RNA polymerase specialized sigma24 family protein
MEKHSKISLLASDKSIYEYAYRVAKGNDLHKDIVSEALIYLYDMNIDKFNSISDLKSYVCKMIWLSWNSTSSPFYKKFKNEGLEITKDIGFINIDSALEELNVIEADIESRKNRMAFEVRLFKMYVELGSYRLVSNKVGIPVMTCYKLINSVREKMKQQI